MSRQKIAMARFKWKPAPWMIIENIWSLWIYCKDGILSFEFELDPALEIPATGLPRATHSKNLRSPNFTAISEQTIISAIKAHILELDVCGARGKGIIVGELTVPVGGKEKKMIVLSTLKDWRDWLQNKRTFRK